MTTILRHEGKVSYNLQISHLTFVSSVTAYYVKQAIKKNDKILTVSELN